MGNACFCPIPLFCFSGDSLNCSNSSSSSSGEPPSYGPTGPNDMGLSWQSIVFLVVSLPSIFIYLLIILTILVRKPSSLAPNPLASTKKLNDAFYNLVLSQAIVDLLSAFFFFFTNTLRSLPQMGEFFFENSSWTAPLGFNTIFFFVILRAQGITLFSIQRFLVICVHMNNEKYKKQPLWRILLLHWVLPICLSLPIFLNNNMTYGSSTNLSTEVSNQATAIASGIACASLLIYGLIAFVCYVAVMRNIYDKSAKHNMSKIKQRECRLSGQVLLQILSIFFLLSYHGLQFYCSLQRCSFPFRPYYPIFTALLSYVNPWTFLFLNKTLRNEMFAFLGKKPNSSVFPVTNIHFPDPKTTIAGLGVAIPRTSVMSRKSSPVKMSLANQIV